MAVRSGDDVFVTDRCRKKASACDVDDCSPITKAIMFLNGELTPGTRVYKQNEGMRFDVRKFFFSHM